jgi:hypothetical protein
MGVQSRANKAIYPTGANGIVSAGGQGHSLIWPAHCAA